MAVFTSHVTMTFTEEGDRTRAEAIAELGTERFHAIGEARRARGDPDVPIIGEELAAARALSDLSAKLLEAAAARVETHRR